MQNTCPNIFCKNANKNIKVKRDLAENVDLFINIHAWFSLWCLTALSTLYSYIVAISFIGGGNQWRSFH
jgi:hypothetical protein